MISQCFKLTGRDQHHVTVLSIKYDGRKNCLHVMSNCFNWHRTLYIIFKIDNETVYSTWNDLQRSLKVIGCIRSPGLSIRDHKSRLHYFFTSKKQLKWPWRLIKVIGNVTILQLHITFFLLVACSNDVSDLYDFSDIQRQIMVWPWNLG